MIFYIFLGQHLDEINSGKISTKYDKYTVIPDKMSNYRTNCCRLCLVVGGDYLRKGGGEGGGVAIHALGPGNRQFPL